MPEFGTTSSNRLRTCDQRLVAVFNRVIETVDCGIICGVRSAEDQAKAYDMGHTQAQWPHSKHNIRYPDHKSRAVDALPYHLLRPHYHWGDHEGIWKYAQFVLATASEMGIELVSGCDWNGDGVPTYLDNAETFFDGPHYELVGD